MPGIESKERCQVIWIATGVNPIGPPLLFAGIIESDRLRRRDLLYPAPQTLYWEEDGNAEARRRREEREREGTGWKPVLRYKFTRRGGGNAP